MFSSFQIFTPQNTDIVILDSNTSYEVHKCLPKRLSFTEIEFRNKYLIIFNLRFLYYFFYFFYRSRKIKYSLILSLIKIKKPKVVITCFDNNEFIGLVGIYFPEIKNIAIQNGLRSLIPIHNWINIKVLTISPSDLNICPLNKIKDFLKSDLYIVFGSSYIKGDLIEFLISKRAINIHMGISPYYRGTDCNFWAMYDKNYHVVGATIHLISKGIDNGKILYHALSKRHENPFIYSMNTVISAFNSLKSKISDNSIFSLQEVEQDISKEIRYSKNKDFDDKAICNFLKQKKLPDFKFDNSMLINPYFHEI